MPIFFYAYAALFAFFLVFDVELEYEDQNNGRVRP